MQRAGLSPLVSGHHKLGRAVDRAPFEGVHPWSTHELAFLTIALLLIVGGVVGFLPILGFWMIPLGLLFLAQDVPFLQRPILQALTWLERRWVQWKRRLYGGRNHRGV